MQQKMSLPSMRPPLTLAEGSDTDTFDEVVTTDHPLHYAIFLLFDRLQFRALSSDLSDGGVERNRVEMYVVHCAQLLPTFYAPVEVILNVLGIMLPTPRVPEEEKLSARVYTRMA